MTDEPTPDEVTRVARNQPTSRREQCSPPQPGDQVWIGDRRHLLMPDGSLRDLTPPTRGPTFGDWLADKVFCTACLRLRFSPGHLLFCRGWGYF